MSAHQSTALILAGLQAVELSASEEAIATRDSLLERARRGNAIDDAAGASRAADLLKELKAFSRTIEATRKEVKGPIDELGKRVQALAATLTADIQREEARIGQLLADFQAEQNRIAAEARQRAWEEEERIRIEAEEKQREADEAARLEQEKKDEAARIAAEEAEAKAAGFKTKAARDKALAQAAAIREKAEADKRAAQEKADKEALELQQQTAQNIAAAHQTVATVAAPKVEGIATRKEVEFVVEDAVALYEALPVAVKLVPEVAILKAALKKLAPGQSIPGVRHWLVNRSTVR